MLHQGYTSSRQAGFNYGGSLATSLHTFLQHGDPTYHSVVKEVMNLYSMI